MNAFNTATVRPLNILLVGEDPAFAAFVQSIFTRQNTFECTFKHIPRLAEALQCFGQSRVDVILLSLAMPEAYGNEALKPVRSCAPRAAIIALLGQTALGLAPVALQEGAQDYLVKDQIDENALLRAIRYAIERKKSESRLAAFSHLGYQLSSATTPLEAARIIAGIADALLTWDAFNFDLYSADTGEATSVLLVDTFEGKRRELPGHGNHPPTSTMMKTISVGAQLILNPAQVTELVSFGNESRISESIMMVPIRHASQPVGVLSIHSYTPNAYDRDTLGTLQALSDHCGGALDRIRAATALKKSQEQLLHAQKMDAIGQLAGGIAHDFNNLLTIINGRSHAALATLFPGDPLHRDLELIYKTGERAAELTRQLLAFKRSPVLQPAVLDLNSVLSNMNLGKFVRENIEFKLIPSPYLRRINADPKQISHAIVNLIVNACEAMPDGGKLTIQTFNVTLDEASLSPGSGLKTGDHVMLTLSDTGTGMDDATRDRIFEPFFTTKEDGAGLGLSTVYGIIRQCHGCITVESSLGQGSTFKIYLPSVDEEPQQPDESPDAFRGNETILLVEDEEGIRDFARQMLTMRGYKVLEARSCSEAILLYERHKNTVALLLTDIVMPRMSGRDLARILTTAHPGLKVLYMSGYSDNSGSSSAGLIEATTAFLQKPFTQTELWRKVRETLRA